MDPIRNVIDAFFDTFFDAFEREESLIFDTFSLKKIIMMKNDPLVVDKVVIGVGSVIMRDKILGVVKPRLKGEYKKKGIFIDTDKTANELKIDYGLRQELKKLKSNVPVVDQGKYYFYIHDKCIYKVLIGGEDRVKVYSVY